MRVAAYVSYGIAVATAAVIVIAAVGLGREYGWELSAALGWIPVVLVAVGLPTWIASLFHRRALDHERPQPNG